MTSFLRLLKYVRRTVTRARVRSLLTVVGAALAIALFAFVRMLEGGVDRMAEQADQPVLVVFETSRFCPLTSLLPDRYADDIARIEGVDAVLPTLLFINSCRANLDLITLHGVLPDLVAEMHEYRIVAGDDETWKHKPDGALVGKRIAERRGLAIGDRLRVGNVDLSVDGILESAAAGLDNVVFTHMDQLQLARKQQGIATEFLVRVRDGVDPETVAQRIDEHFAGDERQTDTKTMQAFVQGAVGEVAEVIDFARAIGYLAVLIVVLILGNTVYISTQARRAELGVMETMGATRPVLVGLIAAESVLLSVAGGVLGVGAVMIWLASFPLTLGVEGWGIDVLPDPVLAIVSLGVAALVGVVAAVGPAVDTLTRPLSLAMKED
ncbi:MAG: ABC transporter permease [Planctomycetota bacterium]|nr:ABC transporter permease [Planctomycetota bacterium]